MTERFETFTVLVNRISRNIRRIKNQEMSAYQLRSAHVSCLYYLYSTEGLTAAELCERCEEDKATISRSLDYLEENGYLNHRPQEEKRYRNQLSLTQKGREAGKRIWDKINGVLMQISGSLTEEERASFYRSLSIISDSLETVRKQSEKD